jgi:hypothetical protein
MHRKTLKILGLNPGSKYLGLAIFHGSDLRYWGIKVLAGRWSKGKIEKTKEVLSDLFVRYDIGILAIKKLHPSRNSPNLNRLVAKTREFSKRKGMRVYQYSIKDVENFFSPGERTNKKKLAETIASEYPALFHELDKEKNHKNPYHIRMFEAVALASACFHHLDKH